MLMNGSWKSCFHFQFDVFVHEDKKKQLYIRSAFITIKPSQLTIFFPARNTDASKKFHEYNQTNNMVNKQRLLRCYQKCTGNWLVCIRLPGFNGSCSSEQNPSDVKAVQLNIVSTIIIIICSSWWRFSCCTHYLWTSGIMFFFFPFFFFWSLSVCLLSIFSPRSER